VEEFTPQVTPIRIVMLVDSFLAGGAERIAVEVACGLDRTLFEPMVIATRSGGPLQVKLQSEGIPHLVLGRRRGFSPLKLLKAHRAIAGAGILHAHKYGSNMWGALLARTTRVPLVVREPTFNGVRSKRRSLGYRYWVAPVARRVICPTEVVARSLVEDGFSPGQISVIPNGVPLDAALSRAEARAELDLDGQARVVGIVARLRLEKAHEVLFRAVAHIAGARPDLRLAVVGDGSRRDELKQLARELGIEDVVVWAGERRDARRVVSAFDVGVICSSWEGLPVAALETMAAGVPLVATRVGTMPEILAGGAGALVAVGDDRGLADTLARLLDDAEEARAIGERGRERIRREHAFERMIKEFVDVYDEVEQSCVLPGRRARFAGAS
jgi:glycosyltransferase involved in cell wall biosynthesis